MFLSYTTRKPMKWGIDNRFLHFWTPSAFTHFEMRNLRLFVGLAGWMQARQTHKSHIEAGWSADGKSQQRKYPSLHE
jgi:hypothetical protein